MIYWLVNLMNSKCRTKKRLDLQCPRPISHAIPSLCLAPKVVLVSGCDKSWIDACIWIYTEE